VAVGVALLAIDFTIGGGRQLGLRSGLRLGICSSCRKLVALSKAVQNPFICFSNREAQSRILALTEILAMKPCHSSPLTMAMSESRCSSVN